MITMYFTFEPIVLDVGFFLFSNIKPKLQPISYYIVININNLDINNLSKQQSQISHQTKTMQFESFFIKDYCNIYNRINYLFSQYLKIKATIMSQSCWSLFFKQKVQIKDNPTISQLLKKINADPKKFYQLISAYVQMLATERAGAILMKLNTQFKQRVTYIESTSERESIQKSLIRNNNEEKPNNFRNKVGEYIVKQLKFINDWDELLKIKVQSMNDKVKQLQQKFASQQKNFGKYQLQRSIITEIIPKNAKQIQLRESKSNKSNISSQSISNQELRATYKKERQQLDSQYQDKIKRLNQEIKRLQSQLKSLKQKKKQDIQNQYLLTQLNKNNQKMELNLKQLQTKHDNLIYKSEQLSKQNKALQSSSIKINELLKQQKVLQQQSAIKISKLLDQNLRIKKQNVELKKQLSEIQLIKTRNQTIVINQSKSSALFVDSILVHLFYQSRVLKHGSIQTQVLNRQNIQKMFKNKIAQTKLVFSFDKILLNHFKDYIKGMQNLLLICRSEIGTIIGGYTRRSFEQTQNNPGCFIFSLFQQKDPIVLNATREQKCTLNDQHFLVFGSSEIRIKCRSLEGYCAVGSNSSIYRSSSHLVNFEQFTHSRVRQFKIQCYEIYQIRFQ